MESELLAHVLQQARVRWERETEGRCAARARIFHEHGEQGFVDAAGKWEYLTVLFQMRVLTVLFQLGIFYRIVLIKEMYPKPQLQILCRYNFLPSLLLYTDRKKKGTAQQPRNPDSTSCLLMKNNPFGVVILNNHIRADEEVPY